jgi:hypothetical protein
MQARQAISRFRRDLTLSTALNFFLALGAIFCILLPLGTGGFMGTMLLTVVGTVWLILSYQSIKGSRLAMSSPGLIAQGKLEDAEHQIEQSLRSFSLFRAAKLLSLHHLALLRHAQKRYEDSAQLSRELIKQRAKSLGHVQRQSQLLLAEALLELGDLNGAYQAISQLYHQRLSLSEALNLLAVQLDYQTRINAWEQIFQGVEHKVQLAELMQSPKAARVQAQLALAARKVGREDWAQWLRKRAELLADVGEMTKTRPMLWELWAAPASMGDIASSTG